MFIKMDPKIREGVHGLKGSPLATYVVLASHIDFDGEAWPSEQTLAFETGYSKRQVQRAIEALRGKGLVGIARQEGKSNAYHVNTYFHCGKGEIPTTSMSTPDPDDKKISPPSIIPTTSPTTSMSLPPTTSMSTKEETIKEDIGIDTSSYSNYSTSDDTHVVGQSYSSSMTLQDANSETRAKEIWDHVKQEIKTQIGNFSYDFYLADSEAVGIDKNKLIDKSSCCNLHQLEKSLKGQCERTAGMKVSFIGGEE